MAECGIAFIQNDSGRTVYVTKSAINADPWQFVLDGVLGPLVTAAFKIDVGKNVGITCGNLSVDADLGPNFFIRFEDNNDAPFDKCIIYCSGEPGEHTNYRVIEQDGKPALEYL